jgi:prevent-host-death family protein
MVPRRFLPAQPQMCTHLYVNIRELRANLAAAVRRAESGQRIVITVGGRAVAQLGPLEPLGREAQPTIDDLAARGLVVKARRGDRPPPDLVVAMPVGTRLDRLLAEVR